ncbi:folate family ECF transporter S component [Carnobacteriaceae bacterium zg-ZUI252]|nr:folate family ECF transporter S component [Carnobacteriaceae bacterium zg-ZUI252]MBS4769720.1 folate family ECF transporter S component [Carnobacteriaceae bacterium zg-ZUI240]
MKKFNTKQLVFAALLVTLNVILQGPLFKFDFGGIVQVGWSFIPSALIGVVFGPVFGFIAGALADVISFFLFPSGYPFFIGYTLSSALGPMLYGLFLYRRKITIPRIFLSVLFITIFVNLGLGTLWVSVMRGKSFIALLPVRLYKNALSLFLNTAILASILSTPLITSMIKKYQVHKGE